MVDPDTFLTTLHVMVDDFCKTTLAPEKGPGPKASRVVLGTGRCQAEASGLRTKVQRPGLGVP